MTLALIISTLFGIMIPCKSIYITMSMLIYSETTCTSEALVYSVHFYYYFIFYYYYCFIFLASGNQ